VNWSWACVGAPVELAAGISALVALLELLN